MRDKTCAEKNNFIRMTRRLLHRPFSLPAVIIIIQEIIPRFNLRQQRYYLTNIFSILIVARLVCKRTNDPTCILIAIHSSILSFFFSFFLSFILKHTHTHKCTLFFPRQPFLVFFSGILKTITKGFLIKAKALKMCHP